MRRLARRFRPLRRRRGRGLSEPEASLSTRAGGAEPRRRSEPEASLSTSFPIDHIGIVVSDLEAAERIYTETLKFSRLYHETVEEQGVEIVGIAAGNAVIELLKPLSSDSAIEKFRGDAPSKLHHVAYRVDDIRAELARLKAQGVRLIDETPRKGAHGNTIAFLHPKSTGGVLIELCQKSPSYADMAR